MIALYTKYENFVSFTRVIGLNIMINYLFRVCTCFSFVFFSVIVMAQPTNCKSCHSKQFEQWSTSQHAIAMAPATSESVLGNFSGKYFNEKNFQVTFDQVEEKFFVHITENNEASKWQVKYTFGVYPLQQYLIDIGDGRLQALNIAWDTRPVAEGGQRWFRLGAAEKPASGSAMHWQGIYQNWNNQCADCHSTGLIRNYNPINDSYQTDWSYLAVGCVACHENAKTHASAMQKGIATNAGVNLAAAGAWSSSTKEQPPSHQGPASAKAQVPTCGRCHSLRTNLIDSGSGQVHKELSLSRLVEPLYYSDGRVREEVFVMGSFEQSKMFQAGVVCTDCHNPHTGNLKLEGNAVCTQCHNTADFDTPKHHHHSESSQGAQCVSCHMPEATFMKIDARREHSFTVPRLDISKASGSPDVCLACHIGRDRDWSTGTVERWFPDSEKTETWYETQRQELPRIIDYLTDPAEPAIRRATLLEQHGEVLAQQHLTVLKGLIGSDSAVIRESVFKTLKYGNDAVIKKIAEIGLGDSTLVVRIAAFESLVQLGVQSGPTSWEKVRAEYEHYLNMQSDLPSGSLLKARYLLSIDSTNDEAEKLLKRALQKDAQYTPATILLTDILRSDGRNHEAIIAIDRSLAIFPNEASLIHLRGLVHLKLKDYPIALKNLERAAELEPGQWLFGYRYALVLYQLKNKEKAREVIRPLLERFPNNTQVQALADYL